MSGRTLEAFTAIVLCASAVARALVGARRKGARHRGDQYKRSEAHDLYRQCEQKTIREVFIPNQGGRDEERERAISL